MENCLVFPGWGTKVSAGNREPFNMNQDEWLEFHNAHGRRAADFLVVGDTVELDGTTCVWDGTQWRDSRD